MEELINKGGKDEVVQSSKVVLLSDEDTSEGRPGGGQEAQQREAESQ